MKNVYLHGELGSTLGKHWELEVDSVQEALWAIEANTGKLTEFLSKNQDKFEHYTFSVDNKTLEKQSELESSLPKQSKNIHIMPQVAGGEIGSIIVAIVVSIATGLIMQALFKPPKPKEEKETKSYLFSGPVNTAAQGIPIPIGYGRLRVGSSVISASLRHQQLYEFDGYEGKIQDIGTVGGTLRDNTSARAD